ncbi:MAG TPA: GxxExxY protein [Bacteroidia bacterium]|jgi:GxxExxY protein|nr:GxxExxY protein [Bacteroidia bacterium]
MEKGIKQKQFTEDEYTELTTKIVSCCVSVHKEMGPGLLESVYEYCLMKEFELRGINAQRQVEIPLIYKGFEIKKYLTIDILVEEEIVLEIKSAEAMNPLYEAQLLSYLKLASKKIGYLLNFNVPLMKSGIRRMRNGY